MTPPNELEQLAEFQDAIQSNKGLERLRAMQYLQQMNNQGLMGMPQVTEQPVVQRSNGSSIAGGLFEKGYEGNPNEAFNMAEGSSYPYQPQYNPYFDMSGESGDEMGSIRDNENRIEGERQQKEMQQKLQADPNSVENIYKAAEVIVKGGNSEDRLLAQDIYRANREAVQRVIDAIRNNPEERAGGGQVAPDSMAQGLAGLGRNGDSMLLHINPEELQGLASVGQITYNPITGLPEAWGFKSFFKPFKQAARSIKKIAKSKAFRMIAPIALTIAAPYLAAAWGMGGTAAAAALAGTATTAGSLSAAVAAMGPVAFGLSTAVGSGLGALASGAKPKDALKAAALSGITAGGLRGYSNYMDPNVNVWGDAAKAAGTTGTTAAQSVGDLSIKTNFNPTSGPALQSPTGPIASVESSLVSPNYYSPSGQEFGGGTSMNTLNTAGSGIQSTGVPVYGSTAGAGITQGGGIPNVNIGGAPIQMDPSLLQTNIPATSAYTGNAPNMTGDKYSPVDYPAQDARTINIDSNVPSSSASNPEYNTLYGSETASQITPPGGEVGGRLTTGSGDQSYAVGGKYNYAPDSIKDQAMDALTDNRLARGVDQATDYAGQMPIGKGQTLGDLGNAIVSDYGTLGGGAELLGMAATTPDYLGNYAMEDERKRQIEELEKLGYGVELSDEDTGFNQTIVVRDPSGKVLPSDLSLQDLLDRAYGRTPRTRFTDRITYGPANAKHGGLINLAGGGNFSGMVQGNGHGMEDNVYMPIEEQGQQVGTLAVSPSEYVVDAYTMSALGNGNANQGAKVMDGVVESVRKKAYGTIRQPNEISGLQALKPMMMGV